jgi:hypothetical protein
MMCEDEEVERRYPNTTLHTVTTQKASGSLVRQIPREYCIVFLSWF